MLKNIFSKLRSAPKELMASKSKDKVENKEGSKASNKEDSKEKKKTNIEIERKFLMKGFPDDSGLFLLEASLIHQSYLSIEPEVRIRSQIFEDGSSEYKQAIKGNGTLKRVEVEIVITEKQFDGLLGLIAKNPIEKVFRVYILEDGSQLQVSHVDNTWFYGEVEFESEEQAKKWKITSLLQKYTIKEITEDSDYKMKNYWKRTRIDK